jgi:hypothetical protein
VFLETPNVLAIILIGNRSARCNRRISAQSSTFNTPSSSRLDVEPDFTDRGSKFSCRTRVSFHLPRTRLPQARATVRQAIAGE